MAAQDGGSGTDPARARLRLLSITDLHGHLLPWDYYAARPLPATGLAQAGALIRRLRAEAPGGACLLLDNGDVLSGSPLADGIGGEEVPEGHPVVAAMNALGFDAGTVGNHDFDAGLPALRAAVAGARFPVVCANLLGPEGVPLLPPWALIESEAAGEGGLRHPLRVGVLGVAPPQTAGWNRHVLGCAVVARDMVEAAAGAIAALRAAGADLVVGLCHTGTGEAAPAPMAENAGMALARLAGLDALVLGHTHRVFPGPGWDGEGLDPEGGAVAGKPAVQPGFHGRHVGVIDLWLERRGDGDGGAGWRVAGHRARAERVTAELPPDPGVAAAAAPRHARLLRRLEEPAGETVAPLQSYFSLVAPDPVLAAVAGAQAEAARRLLGGRPEAALPLLSAVAPFRAGGRGGPGAYVDIPAGPVRLRQAAELYLHPNTLCLLEITGAGLRDWLERSASVFRRLVPGRQEQPLIDPAFAAWNFDVVVGLDWAVDPSGPARTDAEGRLLDPGARRVRELAHAGRPVADGDRFVLATNSYRLGGGGGFVAAAAARPLLVTALPIRELVLERLSRGPLGRDPRPAWRFAPLPGTAAWFDTGPGALRHLDALGDRVAEPVGPTAEGFHRFRLRL